MLEIKAGTSPIGCWITNSYNSAINLACFYVPEGICLLIATCLILDCVRTIKKVTRFQKMSEARRKRTIETYIRFGGFILLILLNVLMLFTYKFYTFGKEDKWRADFAEE